MKEIEGNIKMDFGKWVVREEMSGTVSELYHHSDFCINSVKSLLSQYYCYFLCYSIP
jgi:hypothetical protein